MTTARSSLSLASLVVGTLLVGCQKNVGAVDSTAAKEIVPVTGSAAASSADALSTVRGGPAAGKRDPRLETVLLLPGPEQPVGIALSKSGRTFLSFPRWADPVKNTLVELKDGGFVPFPDAQTNAFNGANLALTPPDKHFISAQAPVFDARDRLWVLDPGGINFASSILNGPKLWGYDINTGKPVKQIGFPNDVALKMTGLNDVRIDLRRGPEGTAYITDSGVGGLIVVDLASGQSWRHLDKHPSVLPTPGLKQTFEGEPFLSRKANSEVAAPDFRADGIALSPDGKTLYYTVVAARDVWSVPTDLLAERDPAKEADVRAGVKRVATKPSGNDGILCDDQGRLYTTDFEDNAIRRVDPADGSVTVVVQDARLIWPDTLALHDGYLYVTSNQLARQPNYHFGQDKRQPPYALFRVKIDAQSAATASRE